MSRCVVLVIGGLDPSGGAGIGADVQTATALGVHPAPVATMVTVQDTVRLWRCEPLPGALVADQARAVLADMRVSAVKLGALGNAAVGAAVADVLNGYAGPVVTDPVLAASAGGALADAALAGIYRERLFPLTAVATPNRKEFDALGGDDAVCGWIESGLGACLVTGGDGTGDLVRHLLYDARGRREVEAGPRRAGVFHGTGCTFASAIAARLARGDDVQGAITAAGEFLQRSLARAFAPGQGQEIPGRW